MRRCSRRGGPETHKLAGRRLRAVRGSWDSYGHGASAIRVGELQEEPPCLTANAQAEANQAPFEKKKLACSPMQDPRPSGRCLLYLFIDPRCPAERCGCERCAGLLLFASTRTRESAVRRSQIAIPLGLGTCYYALSRSIFPNRVSRAPLLSPTLDLVVAKDASDAEREPSSLPPRELVAKDEHGSADSEHLL